MDDLKPKEDGLGALDRNIASVHRARKASDDNRRVDQKFVDRVATFAGSTSSLYFHFGVYGIWLFILFFAPYPIRRSFGATVNNISSAASLEAIFLAVFVLINQKRMNALERKNSDLHLQMSLLAEHEVTRLAQILDLITQRLGVNTQQISGLEDVKKDIHPDEILERISEHEKQTPTDSTSDNWVNKE